MDFVGSKQEITLGTVQEIIDDRSVIQIGRKGFDQFTKILSSGRINPRNTFFARAILSRTYETKKTTMFMQLAFQKGGTKEGEVTLRYRPKRNPKHQLLFWRCLCKSALELTEICTFQGVSFRGRSELAGSLGVVLRSHSSVHLLVVPPAELVRPSVLTAFEQASISSFKMSRTIVTGHKFIGMITQSISWNSLFHKHGIVLWLKESRLRFIPVTS